MKKPADLSPAHLQHIVEEIQYLLYREVNFQGREIWNADKEWDRETLESVAKVLREADLAPEKHDA